MLHHRTSVPIFQAEDVAVGVANRTAADDPRKWSETVIAVRDQVFREMHGAGPLPETPARVVVTRGSSCFWS